MTSSSLMHMNPDIPEAHALRGWYDAAGAEQTFHAHTGGAFTGGGASFERAEIRNISEIKATDLTESDKPQNFSSRATIMHIKPDNIAYPACPDCGKKVVDIGTGWRCEKCSKTHTKPQHRCVLGPVDVTSNYSYVAKVHDLDGSL